MLHGGIQSIFPDELASWVVQTYYKTVGVTSSMQIACRRPGLVSDGEITLRGRVKEAGTKMAIIETGLLGNDGKLSTRKEIMSYLQIA